MDYNDGFEADVGDGRYGSTVQEVMDAIVSEFKRLDIYSTPKVMIYRHNHNSKTPSMPWIYDHLGLDWGALLEYAGIKRKGDYSRWFRMEKADVEYMVLRFIHEQKIETESQYVRLNSKFQMPGRAYLETQFGKHAIGNLIEKSGSMYGEDKKVARYVWKEMSNAQLLEAAHSFIKQYGITDRTTYMKSQSDHNVPTIATLINRFKNTTNLYNSYIEQFREPMFLRKKYAKRGK